MNSLLLELFQDFIYFPEDNTSVYWTIDGESVVYNKENNKEDLFNQNGETYSGYIKEGPIEVGRYVMYTLDSQCGWDYQAIFCSDLFIEED